MATKKIDKVGPDLVEETSVLFVRQEDGSFKKNVKVYERDRKTNNVKLKNKLLLDERYLITTDDDFDDKMEYDDFNGDRVTIRFKRIDID